MTRFFGKLLTALVCIFFAFNAIADNFDMAGKWGIGFGAGGHNSMNSDFFNNQTDEEFVAGLWFRHHLSTSWALELSYDRFDYKNQDLRNEALDLSLALRMWANKRFRLLAQIGAGLTKVKDYPGFREETYDAFSAKGRLGFELMLSQSWALGLHADYHYIDVKKEFVNEMHILAPMLGFTYYFGSQSSKFVDSDGDGVGDDMDKCPNTMAGPAVDRDGCPLKKEKAVVDSDYDGVPDSEDQCPQSEMGKQVNDVGCSPREKIEFTLKVQFASGRWSLDDKYKPALVEFAEFLKKYPNTSAEIAGHTDTTGEDKFNYFISQKRAESVRSYLIEKFSIPPHRLRAKGYGPSQPIADNNTLEGRKANRRVVATVETLID